MDYGTWALPDGEVSAAEIVEEIVVREVRGEKVLPEAEANNLVELFETSPFKGLSMKFERDPDYGREKALSTIGNYC